MSTVLDPPILDRLCALLTARSGMRVGATHREDLERCVRAAAPALGFVDPLLCARWLVSSAPSGAQIRLLASFLTVGETYFFREKGAFRAMEEQILPGLIQARRGGDQRLRLWSAGCCTGEEAYSLAIVLARLLSDRGEWNIKLLATDINEQYLKKAAEGVYGEWSFRDPANPPSTLYFERTDDHRYRVLPHLGRQIAFSPLNLAEDTYPSALNDTANMDLILCRNVLIYLDEPCAARVTRRLSQCLGDQGWLVVGAAEVSMISDESLVPVRLAGLTRSARRRVHATRPIRRVPWHSLHAPGANGRPSPRHARTTSIRSRPWTRLNGTMSSVIIPM